MSTTAAHESNDSDDFQSSEASDWPAKISSTVVNKVGLVRDKTTGPALVASRYIVYLVAIGLVAAVLVIIALVVAFRALVAATSYLPFVEANQTWLAYLIFGSLFLIAGMLFWRKKEQ